MRGSGDPLAGGPREAAIGGIRAAGGGVSVAFGGMGGTRLGLACSSPEALAGACQQVISACRLRAIDLDIEDTEIGSAAARQRIISALTMVRQRDPGLMISVTIAAGPGGPEPGGQDLITRAAAAGIRVGAWTIMPFGFAGPGTDMGQASVQAAEGLKNDLMNAYHEPAPAAWRTMGISSMNGRADAGELVSVADFQLMLRSVQARAAGSPGNLTHSPRSAPATAAQEEARTKRSAATPGSRYADARQATAAAMLTRRPCERGPGARPMPGRFCCRGDGP